MVNYVVCTAGHVDHGKSTLINALTGADPDRWEEEKERGLTIDLGFAQFELPSGKTVSFIDVPGHDGDRGFGGKCFPKDINAMIQCFSDNNIEPMLLNAAWERNKKVRTKTSKQ